MTEVELYQRPRAVVAVTERDVVDGWVEVVGKTAKLADMIADTDFVPKALRNKPAAITACMLTGREIGIGPMLSMKVIHMVQGTPSLSSEYKRARALESGHEIVYEETTTARCVVRGRRRGEDNWLTITWTIDDAKRAKLLGKDVWQQHPRRMLEARATGELCDLKFPDCTWGLPTTEVLEDGGVVLEDGTPGDAADARAIEPPKPRTAQRRTRTAEAIPAPTSAPAADSKPAASVPAAAPQSEQPPLPGEDDEPEVDKDAAGTVTKDQLTKLGAVFTGYGFRQSEREHRLTISSQIVNREIGSASELSLNEARALIDTLEACGSRENLIALMAAGDEEPPDPAAAAAAERAFSAGGDGE